MSIKPDYEQDRKEAQNWFWSKVPMRFRRPLAFVIIIVTCVAVMATVGSLVTWAVQVGQDQSDNSQTEEAAPSGEPDNADGFVTVEVCRELDDVWSKETYIEPGELAKCKVRFQNDNSYRVEDVVLSCVLTANLEIVDNNAVVVGDSAAVERVVEGFAENADVNMGDFSPGETAEVIFSLKAVSAETEGKEAVTVSVSVNGDVHKQSAFVEVENSNGGWGDNTVGRRAYTDAEVQDGALGSIVTFNSISDGEIGHEFNFVGARGVDESGAWHADSIGVEDGRLYRIRFYVHNDNPGGYGALAKDVKVTFSLPMRFSKSQTVVGYLDSPNAVPDRYWDSVTLKGDSYFYLEYIEGSARWFNAGIGAEDGVPLTDEIICQQGTTVGYAALDGLIPGGEEYIGVATIDVMAHMLR